MENRFKRTERDFGRVNPSEHFEKGGVQRLNSHAQTVDSQFSAIPKRVGADGRGVSFHRPLGRVLYFIPDGMQDAGNLIGAHQTRGACPDIKRVQFGSEKWRLQPGLRFQGPEKRRFPVSRKVFASERIEVTVVTLALAIREVNVK